MVQRYLQAETDAQNRPPSADHTAQSFVHATAPEAAHRRAGCSHPGEDDPLGAHQFIRVGADTRGHADLATGTRDAVQIARVVIYDQGLVHLFCQHMKARILSHRISQH